MANFTMHFSVAAAGGTLLGGLGWQFGLWSLDDGFAIAGLTALGGVVPDIDADHSRAVRLIFTVMAILSVIGVVTASMPFLGITETSLAGVLAFFTVRYPLSAIFKHYSVHRGVWHSLLAALLTGALVAVVSYQFFLRTPLQSWHFAGATLIGVLIHLLLDEIYSIDMMGTRLKRSFGTAFKLYDYKTPSTALLMSVVIVSLTPWLPPLATLGQLMGSIGALWY